MSFNITRMTAYALISAIETDLRVLVKDYVQDENNINETIRGKAIERIEKDIGVLFDDIGFSELIDYFDLGDTFQTINSNKELFPPHIISTIKKVNKDFETLIPIRNRVMHIRPLNFDDLPIISGFCDRLLKEDPSITWDNILETMKKIESNPSFVLSLNFKNYDESNGISHNLPIPDFDETGLIGRDAEIKKIKKQCLGGYPVISILGEGGVGKSALALKVAYELIDYDSPFDAVVWVTSKTTQITLHEIHDIKNAIQTSLGVIEEIGNQLIGDSFDGNTFEEVIEYLDTFKIALFIDNLETILDENIRNFVEALPFGSKIIITSRIGLGAYEYPIKLQGIEESYASTLLRTVAKIRGVDSISRLPEPILRKYVNRMHRNPSYIKWFVSSVQTGQSIESVLQNSGSFLDFCMSNVYQYLSEDAQKVTTSMQCSNGYKDLPELAHLNDFDALQIQRAIQELMSTNMLSQISDTKASSVKTMYQLSELASSYLGKHHKPSQSFQKRIRDKRNKLNALFEKQMRDYIANKYNPIHVQFRERSDRVIVKKLQDIQRNINNSEYDQAYEELKEAHSLAPDYFEVARFKAYFYQKTGKYSDAREQYRLAIVLSPDTPQLHFWYGKFLLIQEESIDEAVEQFEIAYNLDENSVELSVTLARGYLLQQKFEESQKILDSISHTIDSADSFPQKMFYDVSVQIKYRTADKLAKSNPVDALLALEQMKDRFDSVPYSFKDKHMRRKLSKCHYVTKRLDKELSPEYQQRLRILQIWLDEESVT